MQPPPNLPPPNLPPPPPAPDAWSAHPWPGGTTAPAAYQPPARRPGSVTAGAVLLIVLAVPPILFAILAFAGAGLFHRINGRFTDPALNDLSDTVVRIIVVLGVLSLLYGITKLVAGILVLARRNAWRITAIVLCVLAAGFWLLALIGTLGSRNSTTEFESPTRGSTAGGVVLSAIFLAANIVAIVLLARSSEYFEGGGSAGGIGAPPPQQQWPQQRPGTQPEWQQQQWPQQPQQWPEQQWPESDPPPGGGSSPV